MKPFIKLLTSAISVNPINSHIGVQLTKYCCIVVNTCVRVCACNSVTSDKPLLKCQCGGNTMTNTEVTVAMEITLHWGKTNSRSSAISVACRTANTYFSIYSAGKTLPFTRLISTCSVSFVVWRLKVHKSYLSNK